jgi:hypothetical protein
VRNGVGDAMLARHRGADAACAHHHVRIPGLRQRIA